MGVVKLIGISAALLFLASCTSHNQQTTTAGAGETCNTIVATVSSMAAEISAADVAGADPCDVLLKYKELVKYLAANPDPRAQFAIDNLAFRRLSAFATLAALNIDLDEIKAGGSDQSVCDAFSNIVCPGLTQEDFKNMFIDAILDISKTNRQLIVSFANGFFKFNLRALFSGGWAQHEGMSVTRTLDMDCFNQLYDWSAQKIESMKIDITCDMSFSDVQLYIKENLKTGFKEQLDECPIMPPPAPDPAAAAPASAAP